MKKLLIVLLFAFIVAVYATNGFVNMTSKYDGDYIFYGGDPLSTTLARNDYGYELKSASPLENQIKRLTLKGVKGETVRFQGGKSETDRMMQDLRVKEIFSQTVGGIEILYGYSSRLNGSILLDGKKVNIQIARRGTTVTVGTPVIFGSY